MKRALPILILAGLCAAVPPTLAMNLEPLLRDTPAELFTVQDYEYFDVALKKALEELGQDGSAQWENPQTLAGGTVTVIQEFQREGSACKRLRVENRARQRRGFTVFDFCRRADGRWALAPTAP
jgi:surface antigen